MYVQIYVENSQFENEPVGITGFFSPIFAKLKGI